MSLPLHNLPMDSHETKNKMQSPFSDVHGLTEYGCIFCHFSPYSPCYKHPDPYSSPNM